MINRFEKLAFTVSLISIPCLFIVSPKWLTLQGVEPNWAVLWLLPWALNHGKIFGLFFGCCLGLFLDGLIVGNITQVPAFVLLGFWWGHLGSQGKPIELSLNLGLLAFLGTIISGLSFWLQYIFLESVGNSSWFNTWAFHTLLAQSILTGLIAPVICSVFLLARKRKKKN